jgi:hypothetical protein
MDKDQLRAFLPMAFFPNLHAVVPYSKLYRNLLSPDKLPCLVEMVINASNLPG